MPNMRGKSTERHIVQELESNEEFDFKMAKEVEDRCKGSDQKNEPESEPTERGGGRTKKGKADMKIKDKTKTW